MAEQAVKAIKDVGVDHVQWHGDVLDHCIFTSSGVRIVDFTCAIEKGQTVEMRAHKEAYYAQMVPPTATQSTVSNPAPLQPVFPSQYSTDAYPESGYAPPGHTLSTHGYPGSPTSHRL